MAKSNWKALLSGTLPYKRLCELSIRKSFTFLEHSVSQSHLALVFSSSPPSSFLNILTSHLGPVLKTAGMCFGTLLYKGEFLEWSMAGLCELQ